MPAHGTQAFTLPRAGMAHGTREFTLPRACMAHGCYSVSVPLTGESARPLKLHRPLSGPEHMREGKPCALTGYWALSGYSRLGLQPCSHTLII